MSKNTLDNLFGSRVRVKILKFLFRNKPVDFGVAELAERVQEPQAVIKRELEMFREIRLVRRKR